MFRAGALVCLLSLLAACTPERRAGDGDPSTGTPDASVLADAGGDCASGFALCGGTCVDVRSDAARCGRCDHACASGESCVAGSCVAGNPCGGVCAPGTWCDASAGACVSGCASDAECPSSSRCDPSAHACVCASGTHACGPRCRSNTDAQSCGASCDPCPVPAHGTATCTGDACGVQCEAGYHLCGDRCVPETSPGACGASCAPCATPANGAATCDGLACGLSCDPGYHQCGTECAWDRDPDTCGGRCSPCPAPANGTATCDGSRCGIACSAGYSRCGDTCVAESASACGSSCQTCTGAPANAVPACVAGQCSFRCNPPALAFGGACVLATAVSAGRTSTCATLTGGAVKCWGGALNPAPFSSGASGLSVGGGHACAIRGGALLCWGDNSNGELGIGGTSGSSATPAQVSNLSSGVVQVSAGEEHTCAVKSDGSLKCWGRGLFGRLGAGSENDSRVPVNVYPTGTVQVAAGGGHTCALLANGTVQCWGLNDNGELGIGSAPAQDCGTGLFASHCKTAPITVPGLANVVAIAAGDEHTCAIVSGGQLKCWGSNRWEQIGASGPSCSTGYNPTCTSPTDVMSGVVAISLGNQATCALLSGGAVKCWGYDDSGEIGNGQKGHYGVGPFQVFASGAAGVTTAQGGYHSCALLANGGVQCWGKNDDGQLGDGTRTLSTTPVVTR